jgi:hypothetical protein
MPLRRRTLLHRLLPVALVASALIVGACSGAGAPVVSFDPASPCTSDGQQPGAYPELEALLPTDLEGTAPENMDSGRTCTTAGLGSLAAAGVKEVHYAGATWQTGGTSGWTIAAFKGDGLDAANLHDFYVAGARSARRTDRLNVSDTTVGGVPAKRLDVLMSDGTGQTVVTWQKPGEDVVWVLLAADVGDTRVGQIIEALAAR